MIRRITLQILLITLFSQLLIGQEKESGIYLDSLGQVYVQASRPVYFFIASDNKLESRILFTSKDIDSNPMYFDGTGPHYIKTIDAETNKLINFKVLADGIAPIVTLNFNNILLKNSRRRVYVEVGSEAKIVAKDNLSGVRKVFVSIDGSDFTNLRTVIFDKETEYQLKTFAIDNVGNISDTIQYKVITAVDSIVKIKNIYFDINSSRLRPESRVELNEIVLVLNEYPEIRIELRAHTDSRGDAAYNLELSEIRAESIVNYFIYRGISKNRLTFKGFGDTKPINDCTKGVSCSEEEHQKNRRVEFKVLPVN